ncbi:MAG: LacI family DNA-binding transcriptional regulator [Povalibacter sp.]
MFTRPAIGTVAAEARVSIKTVSRVINNSSRVTAATREHVMGVIRRLGYSPSPNARRLAGHRSFLIGLPFDTPYALYATEVQSSCRARFRAADYQVVMHACDSRSISLADEIRLFVRSVRVDGVILTPPLSDSTAVIEVLEEEAIPFVRIAPAARSDTARSVLSNDQEYCAGMIERLAGLGHSRIAFVVGQSFHVGSSSRYRGYCDGLRASELPLDPRLIVESDGSFDATANAVRRLLQSGKQSRPTAIFASSDPMAAAALWVAHELGLAVPSDLSIAGFGDEPIASQVWPRISTIRQPVDKLAEQAAGLLLSQLNSPHGSALGVFADLRHANNCIVLRQSTGPAPR